MALYALTAEIRAHVNEAKEAGNEAEMSLWSSRLSDLGLRVADTLVEMGELETATRHLDSLMKQRWAMNLLTGKHYYACV